MNASPRRTHIRRLVVLALAMFLEAAGYGIVAPTLPLLARKLGLGHEQLGFLFALYALVGLILVLPFGYAADRWGRKALLALGFTSLTCASIGYVLALDYTWLAIARAAQGIGGTAIWVASLTMGGDLSSRETVGREVAWITAAWSLGFLLGPALGGVGDLHAPFIAYALICLLALALSVSSLRETQAAPIDVTPRRLARLASLPEVQCSSIATFALAFYFGSFDAFVPWLLDGRGATRLAIAFLFSVLALPSVLLPVLTGETVDRAGDRRILSFGLATNGLLAIGFLDLIDRFPLWMGFLALGVTEVAIYIPAIAMLQRAVQNRDRGTAMAIHILAFSSGFVLGPVACGRLIPLMGYGPMFLLMGLTTLAALGACNLILSLRGHAPPAGPGRASATALPSSTWGGFAHGEWGPPSEAPACPAPDETPSGERPGVLVE